MDQRVQRIEGCRGSKGAQCAQYNRQYLRLIIINPPRRHLAEANTPSDQVQHTMKQLQLSPLSGTSWICGFESVWFLQWVYIGLFYSISAQNSARLGWTRHATNVTVATPVTGLQQTIVCIVWHMAEQKGTVILIISWFVILRMSACAQCAQTVGLRHAMV